MSEKVKSEERKEKTNRFIETDISFLGLKKENPPENPAPRVPDKK